MKKILLLLFALPFLLISCTGEQGPPGPPGIPGPPGSGSGTNTQWKIVDLKVKPADWVTVNPSGPNLFYKAEFNVPEITQVVFKNGIALAYVNWGNALQILPYTIYKTQTNSDGSQVFWEETYDFDYMVGLVTIYFTNSDFEEGKPKEDMNFRFVLLW